MKDAIGLPVVAELVMDCRAELHRVGLTWRSERVLDFCDRATGHRDSHFLEEKHLRILLKKLEAEPSKEGVMV